MDLQKRMALFVIGQVTWPDPDKHGSARCTACRHYNVHLDGNERPTDKGRCALVSAATQRKGLLFFGAKALACSKFERQPA